MRSTWSLLWVSAAAAAVTSVEGWMATPLRTKTSRTALPMAAKPEQTEDPCWQDLYDDDCTMSSVYSAKFVAGKWIKSMPCASSLDEDCDMGGLDVPENRPEAGVDNVDVMNFLGLKKAEGLSSPKPSEDKKEDDDVSP